MSIVTRIEFATICKTTPAIINTNISRKKISTTPGNKRMIDTENPLNKIFKKNQIAIEKQKAAEVKVEKMQGRVDAKKEQFVKADTFKDAIKSAAEDLGLDDDDIDEIFTEEETPKQTKARQNQNRRDEEVVDWDMRKKMADALKAERAAELAQPQVDKLMGNLMPVDLVDGIMRVNIQDIFKSFENELINLASIYCDVLAGGDREKLAEVISKIRVKLNDTIQRTKTSTAQEIENVIESYAETRNRGERR